MGSGKTYWGRKWARQEGLAFYDLDEVIEKEQGKSVADIFENEGEAYFRKIESVALQSFSDNNNCIIACGGGTACFHDNIQWMNKNGTTVYLSADPKYILKRVIEETAERPLIKKLNEAELLFFIEQKLKEREPFYMQAKNILPAYKLDETTFSNFNFKTN